MNSTIRATGNLGSITAPGTFKQKRAAHAAIVIGDLDLRKADFELERCGWVWLNPCPQFGRLVGYPSGQRGQTVNLLAYAFDGSNPSPTTNLKTRSQSQFQPHFSMVS